MTLIIAQPPKHSNSKHPIKRVTTTDVAGDQRMEILLLFDNTEKSICFGCCRTPSSPNKEWSLLFENEEYITDILPMKMDKKILKHANESSNAKTYNLFCYLSGVHQGVISGSYCQGEWIEFCSDEIGWAVTSTGIRNAVTWGWQNSNIPRTDVIDQHTVGLHVDVVIRNDVVRLAPRELRKVLVERRQLLGKGARARLIKRSAAAEIVGRLIVKKRMLEHGDMLTRISTQLLSRLWSQCTESTMSPPQTDPMVQPMEVDVPILDLQRGEMPPPSTLPLWGEDIGEDVDMGDVDDLDYVSRTEAAMLHDADAVLQPHIRTPLLADARRPQQNPSLMDMDFSLDHRRRKQLSRDSFPSIFSPRMRTATPRSTTSDYVDGWSGLSSLEPAQAT